MIYCFFVPVAYSAQWTGTVLHNPCIIRLDRYRLCSWAAIISPSVPAFSPGLVGHWLVLYSSTSASIILLGFIVIIIIVIIRVIIIIIIIIIIINIIIIIIISVTVDHAMTCKRGGFVTQSSQ